MTQQDDLVDQAFIELYLSSQSPTDSGTKSSCQRLESMLDGPSGVVQALLERVWLPTFPSPPTAEFPVQAQGDHAVAILSHLVENHPKSYMGITSQLVRADIEKRFPTSIDQDETVEVSDALLAALTKLLIAPNSNDQTRIATDASAALLHLCKYDHYKYNKGRVTQRMLASLQMMWKHIQQNASRELSSGQIRIASLMIEAGLLGDEEFAYTLLDNGGGCIMDKLLHLALGNDDPLLQMSALDQLERLSVEPAQKTRSDFLLGNDLLRNGLLSLVGADVGEEMDPVNGPAALRLLTEICRVGVSSALTLTIDEHVLVNFQLLLRGFHTALQQFQPQGELERLSFIHAVSSLFGSCSIMACEASNNGSTTSTSELTNFILKDKTLLHDWLSLHTRVSQPKLKSAVLCSMAQVLEPAMWNDEEYRSQFSPDSATKRPNDSIALQLYQAFSDANSGRDTIDLLLSSAKSPFTEERLGAYTLLKVLVMRGATLQLLLLHNDDSCNISFLVYLLNRENESTTEGRIAKYQIVKTMMSQSGTLIKGLVPDKMARELQLWNDRGPHYLKSVPHEMATE